jgi:DNA-binding response OmpR family regulator
MNSMGSILLVAGDREVSKTLSRTLRGERFAVSTARTGGEGLRITRAKRPALVMLDMRLPDTSGAEVCWNIKNDATLKEVLVAVFSAGPFSDQDRLRCLEMGADDFIASPATGNDLPTRLRTLLRLRNTAMERGRFGPSDRPPHPQQDGEAKSKARDRSDSPRIA